LPEHLKTRTPEHLTAFVKLNAQPVGVNSFVDQGSGLINGRALTYAVAPVYQRIGAPRGQGSRVLEGPMARVQATPVAVPPGFQGCSMGEGPLSGSVLFSATGGEIILRGSGRDLWVEVDECYFLNQPVTGDFQAMVQALSRPTGANERAEAGLMVRETLEPGSRYAFLNLTAGQETLLKSRFAANGFRVMPVRPHVPLKLPHPEGTRLRLTRRGDRISAETSQDGGKSYQPAEESVVFDPPLAKTVSVGLAICSHNSSRLSEARFRGLEIQKR
jgi:hypothetical protein